MVEDIIKKEIKEKPEKNQGIFSSIKSFLGFGAEKEAERKGAAAAAAAAADILNWLISLVPNKEAIDYIIPETYKILYLPPAEAASRFFDLYAQIERYLTTEATPKKYTHDTLKDEVIAKFSSDPTAKPYLAILENEHWQVIKIQEKFIQEISQRLFTILKPTELQKIIDQFSKETMVEGIIVEEKRISFEQAEQTFSNTPPDWLILVIDVFQVLLDQLFTRLRTGIGEEKAAAVWDDIFSSIENSFGQLPIFSEVLTRTMRIGRVSLMTVRELERRVEEQAAEIEIVETKRRKAEVAAAAAAAAERAKRQAAEQYADELKKLDKLKDEFLNIAAHELKTPLTPIKGQIQLLLDESFGKLNKEQRKSLEVVLRNEERARILVGDVVDIAKIKSRNLKLIPEEISLEKLIRQAVADFKPEAQEKNIDLTIEEPIELPKITADRNRVIQVLTNLINNAIKFTPERCQITVKAEKRNSEVLVNITDTGIGLSQENIKKLFIPFFQIDTGLTRKQGGTGLGLAISKGIVLEHGGEIWVESEGENKGSTFSFTLPLKAMETNSGVGRDSPQENKL